MALFSAHFLFQLFCGLFSCSVPHEYPSDPLNIAAGSGKTYGSVVVDPYPIVDTESGAVQGYITRTILGKPVYTFEGIPFGETTGGRNRFRNPVPKRSWKGILEAKAPGSPCIQVHTLKFSVLGHEDCLFLNIYTPELPSNKSSRSHPELPVVVWIHGGGFHFGSGDEYGPAYLLDHDLILVTINYRLGIYGFFSTLDDASPGNYGLKDQQLALKWIHSNIKTFGGNPAMITLMGQSSGAVSVHLHMLSEQSRPYFSAGIAFSGNALSSWSITKETHVRTINARIGNQTSCPTWNSRIFVQCLRFFQPHDLARREAFLSDWLQWPVIILGPVIERPALGAFLTEYPSDAYFFNNIAKYPFVLVSMTEEGNQAAAFLDGIFMLRQLTTKWKERAPVFLDYKYLVPPERHDQITDNISEYYLGGKDPATVNSRIYGLMTTDALFHYPLHKSLASHSKIAPTYGSLFGFNGMYSFAGLLGFRANEYGVAHTDDIKFYMNLSDYLPGYKTSDTDYKMVTTMTSWIYNFAAKRKPILYDEDGNEMDIWKPVQNPVDIQVLNIDNEGIKMVTEPKKRSLRFWESLGIFE